MTNDDAYLEVVAISVFGMPEYKDKTGCSVRALPVHRVQFVGNYVVLYLSNMTKLPVAKEWVASFNLECVAFYVVGKDNVPYLTDQNAGLTSV